MDLITSSTIVTNYESVLVKINIIYLCTGPPYAVLCLVYELYTYM